jgi:heme-degrading monooxygenase HmoA
MSVLVIGHMTVDPANVVKLWADRKADFEAVAKESKAQGAIHHRWGVGDGQVVIVDEWPDAQSFQKFFESQATIPELMQAAGVQGPPQFEILEVRSDAPDEF